MLLTLLRRDLGMSYFMLNRVGVSCLFHIPVIDIHESATSGSITSVRAKVLHSIVYCNYDFCSEGLLPLGAVLSYCGTPFAFYVTASKLMQIANICTTV